MSEEITKFDNIYEIALRKYGVDAQTDMLIEEMSELIVALQHNKRDRPANIREELADVLIVLTQIIIAHNEDGKVSKWVDFKLDKLRKNLLLKEVC